MTRAIISSSRRRLRWGTSSLELLVAFTLLTTTLSVATPLVVRHGRLMKSQRDYRLALDELSNQLERLTLLPRAELTAALAELAPSSFVAARLPDAKLSGELANAEIGQRLTLKLSWNETDRLKAPVSLAAWVFPEPQRPGGESAGGESQ